MTPPTCLLARLGHATAVAAMVAGGAGTARADSPEMIKDLGPGKGEWQLDYTGQFGGLDGRTRGRDHSGQSFYGVSDRVAVGGETLLNVRNRRGAANSRLFFNYDSGALILRFRDATSEPVGLGLWLQAGLDEDGEVARLEARAIADRRTLGWWMQGNLAYRRVNEGPAEGSHFAYAAQVSRALAPWLWVGMESSGQAGRISGFRKERVALSQFAGPRLASEFAIGTKVRARLGLSYLRRLDRGSSLRNTVQLSGGVRF